MSLVGAPPPRSPGRHGGQRRRDEDEARSRSQGTGRKQPLKCPTSALERKLQTSGRSSGSPAAPVGAPDPLLPSPGPGPLRSAGSPLPCSSSRPAGEGGHQPGGRRGRPGEGSQGGGTFTGFVCMTPARAKNRCSLKTHRGTESGPGCPFVSHGCDKELSGSPRSFPPSPPDRGLA